MKILGAWVLALTLTACQNISQPLVDQHSLLYDQGFADYQNIYVEGEKEIFALDNEAKVFARSAIKGIREPREQIQALVHSVFSRSDLNLLYLAEANTVANDTFKNRAANCLSMSIMTYALSKELGFGVRFQDIEIPEYWTIREGQSLLNRHINLQILPGPSTEHYRFIARGFEVDFDAQATRPHYPKTLLKLNQVIAMFYNNNGADALLKKNYTEAYAYFRAALLQSPNVPSVLANLGYLYRLTGHYDMAEKIYQRAIDLNTSNLTAWQNLAHLYRYTDRDDLANEIVKRVSKKRASNPFFHIKKGDNAYQRKQWQQALNHYRDALKLDRSAHEVFFGLGKTYFELGNFKRSHYYLKLAKRKSRTLQEQSIYQGKIDMLANLKTSSSI
jgi:tetratricopeptide (TPR) repeat protein